MACAGGADGAGAEAGAFALSALHSAYNLCRKGGKGHTRSIANSGIKWCADNSDVVTLVGLD